MTNEILLIKNLNAYYDRKKVVSDVSLEVKKNEVTALIGPSGCGKSTLLRCINRLHEEVQGATFDGDIILEGTSICSQDAVEVRSHIGMVFQKPNPFPSMSIFENAVAGLLLRGVSRKKLVEVAEKNLRQVGLWDEVKDKLKASGTSLSGGQQQRLCIARALSINPPVILMDEPTSALDPISTGRIEDLIKELKQSVSIVIVTHNLAQASRISDSVAYMYLGELIEFDSTRRMFANPRHQKTQNYLKGLVG